MNGEDYEVDDLEKWAAGQDNFTDDESGVEFEDEGNIFKNMTKIFEIFFKTSIEFHYYVL